MKIYAIRDRLIDYFMTPFAADNDKAVLASLSRMINDPETTDAIASAPHHYQLWRLGEVDDNGHLTAQQELICDASSLIRTGIRTREERGGQEGRQADYRGRGAPSGTRADARAHQHTPAPEMDSETRTTPPARGPAPGVPRDA